MPPPGPRPSGLGHGAADVTACDIYKDANSHKPTRDDHLTIADSECTAYVAASPGLTLNARLLGQATSLSVTGPLGLQSCDSKQQIYTSNTALVEHIVPDTARLIVV